MRIAFMTLPLILTGCGKLTCGDGTKEVDGECLSEAEANRDRDQDGDGYVGAQDCRDDDALSYPGADERCDGVDNDCDGRTDEEDAVDATTFYADRDGDGFGDPAAPQIGCSPPEGTVEAGTDCDDTNPGVHPDAVEIWYDGIDHDCAGDDDFDRDGDGFAGGIDGIDCDDSEATAYPSAEEICGDGIDNDCDGSLGPCGLNGEVLATLGDALAYGASPDEYSGQSVAFLGDVTGDGTIDFGVGSPRMDSLAGSNAGGARVVSSDARGVTSLADSGVILGAVTGALAGASVRAAGDINADGVADLLVAEPGGLSTVHTGFDTGMDSPAEPWAGAVHVVLGPVTSVVSLGTTATIVRGDYANHGLSDMTVLGDQDGDGRAELAIGFNRDSDRGTDAGVVAVFASPVAGVLTLDDAMHIHAAGPGDRAGTAIAALGDVNGDGIDDIAITAPFAESKPPSSPFSGADDALVDVGAVYVVNGPVLRDIYLDDADGIHTGSAAYDRIGDAVGHTGDLNGDGLADLVVGAPELNGDYATQGGAFVVDGPANRRASLDAARLQLHGGDGPEEAGTTVVGTNDTDGDGIPEVAIGAPRARGGAGAVYLVRGDRSGTIALRDADVVFVGEAPGDLLGSALAAGVDMDGDGLGDLLIGAPGNDTAADNAGAAYLFLGQAR